MSEQPSEEKTLPASRRKLRKAREKGQVVTSKETVASAATATALIYLYLRRDAIWEKLLGLWVMDPRDEAMPFLQQLETRGAIVSSLALEVMLPLMALVIATSVLLGLAVTGGPVFSVEPLSPKFSKINPASGFKRVFGRKAMMTFLMHMVRLTALVVVLGLTLMAGWGALINAPVCGLGCATDTIQGVVQPMVIGAVATMTIMALFDYLVQRSEFLREQKMTQTEYKREIKDQMGDPQLRGQMRRDQRQMVQTPTGARQANLLVSAAPGVIVGIRYVEGETPAPMVVIKARGPDPCKRLRSVSKALVVPDRELAAALATKPIGGYVTEDELITQLAPMLHRALSGAG